MLYSNIEFLENIEGLIKRIKGGFDIFSRIAIWIHLKALGYHNLSSFVLYQHDLITYIESKNIVFDPKKYEHFQKVLRLNKNNFFAIFKIWKGIKRDLVFATKSSLDIVYYQILQFYLDKNTSTESKINILKNFKNIILIIDIESNNKKYRHLFGDQLRNFVHNEMIQLNTQLQSVKVSETIANTKEFFPIIENCETVQVKTTTIKESSIIERKGGQTDDDQNQTQTTERRVQIFVEGSWQRLEHLAMRLEELGCIEDQETFKCLFYKGDNAQNIPMEKLKWLKDEYWLGYTLRGMAHFGIVRFKMSNKILKYASYCFLNFEGNPISNSSLSSQLSRLNCEYQNIFSGKLENVPDELIPIFIAMMPGAEEQKNE